MASALQLIKTTTLSSSAAYVEFASISSSFGHLYIVGRSRSDSSGYRDTFGIRFNSDTTTTNYASGSEHYIQVSGASTSYINFNSTSQGNSQMTNAGTVSGGSSTSNNFSVTYNFIPNYSKTAAPYKTQLGVGGTSMYTTGQDGYTIMSVGLWKNTSAISTIRINNVSGSAGFASGTIFSLYGIKKTS